MKTLMLAVLPAIFTFFSMNGIDGNGEHGDKYCAKMKDGRLVVMHEGSVVVTDVKFANGTELKPDGTITAKDGTKSMLKDGECLDKSGMRDSRMEKSSGDNK